MKAQLNILNEESKKVGLKIDRGKTKLMTHVVTAQKIEIEGKKLKKKGEQYKYLGQTIALECSVKNLPARWPLFGKYRETFLNKEVPLCLKRQVSMYYPYNDLRLSSMVTYKRHLVNKMEVCQRQMLGLKQIYQTPQLGKELLSIYNYIVI